MKTLDSFLKNKKANRRVSKLEKFRDEILYIYDNNYKVEVILEFLKLNGIQVSKTAVYNFLAKVKKGKTQQTAYHKPNSKKNTNSSSSSKNSNNQNSPLNKESKKQPPRPPHEVKEMLKNKYPNFLNDIMSVKKDWCYIVAYRLKTTEYINATM